MSVYKIMNRFVKNVKYIKRFPKSSSLKQPTKEKITDNNPGIVRKMKETILTRNHRFIEEFKRNPQRKISIFPNLTIEMGN